MSKPGSFEYKVHTYEIDMAQRATLTTIANFMQESAWHDAENNGFGYVQLNKKKLAWVLSRMLIRVYKYPVWNDKIIVKTWPKGFDGLLALRDFTVHSADGLLLISACSAWLTINQETRRIQPSNQVMPEESLVHEDALCVKLQKITTSNSFEKVGQIKTVLSNIDMVGHVNNVNYLRWAIDYLPIDLIDKNICEIEINFLAEAKINTKIDISYTNEKDDNGILCSMSSNGLEHARCRIKI